MMLKRAWLLALLLPATAWSLDAGLAPTVAPWLNLDSGARSLGLAGASSLLGGSSALGSNPSGLSALKGPEFSFSHQSLGENMAAERAAAGFTFGSGRAVGLAADYVAFGSYDSLEADSNGDVVEGPTVAPRGLSLALGYAQNLGVFDLGLAGRYISDDPDGMGMASGFSGDIGFSYRGPVGLMLGASLNQWGPQLLGTDLPTQVRLGLSYQRPLGEAGYTLMAALEERLPTASAQLSSTHLGLELGMGRTLALRGGYQHYADLGTGQWRLGMGAGIKGYSLDYAFAPGAEGTASHLVSLSVDWDQAFGSPVQQP